MMDDYDSKDLIQILNHKKFTIGSCESFTAGLFCAHLADVSGASSVLKGGLVTYATELKNKIVGIDKEKLERYGVVSKECAIEMVKNTQKIMNVDVCVSFTGNAGPTAWENKPAGLIYCGLAIEENIYVYELQLNMSRNEVREYAVKFMINKIVNLLMK